METIGDRIRARRRQLGMTLDQLSNDTQIPKSTIQRWESGAIKNMGQAGLQKLAVSLNIPINWLLTGEEPDGKRKISIREYLFEYLCHMNNYFLSEDKTTIVRRIGTATFNVPIEEGTVQELMESTADYFGYLLKKRAILYKNDEPDDEEFFDELFR